MYSHFNSHQFFLSICACKTLHQSIITFIYATGDANLTQKALNGSVKITVRSWECLYNILFNVNVVSIWVKVMYCVRTYKDGDDTTISFFIFVLGNNCI